MAALASASTGFRGVALPTESVAPRQIGRTQRVRVGVRAEVDTQVVLNPGIKKDVDKVVDTVQVGELAKPLTAYCRCWRSGSFPLCDGSHAKHNKATGDNVGPLLLKKEKA